MDILQAANKMRRQAQRDRKMGMTFQPISMDKLTIGAYDDEAWGLRPDGSSQGGYVTFCADNSILEGEEALTSILDWRSWKLTRVCRSSLAAETQAFTDALDQLNYYRICLADM